MKPLFTITIKTTKPTNRRPLWIRKRLGLPVMTRNLAEYLLQESRADQNEAYGYAQALASWVLVNPESASSLFPDGKFHRQVVNRILRDVSLTPELRSKLAENPRICAYLI